MSLAATTYAIAQRFGSQSRKLLMLAIADGADDLGKNSWQAIDTLAHKAECSPRTVQRTLRDLETAGHLAIKWGAGPRGTNIIRILFQKLPPGWNHPWEGCHHVTPTVQKPPTTAVRQTTQGGDNGGPSLSPEQSGTEENGEEQGTPPSPPTLSDELPDPRDVAILNQLLDCFPDAPGFLSPAEFADFLAVLPHLRDHTADDWTATLAWNLAPDRIRGRKLWPRDRGEYLRQYFEAVQKIRPWWRATGRRWWRDRKTSAPPRPAPKPAAPTLTREEALALLRSEE